MALSKQKRKIKVFCENNGIEKEYEPGITLAEIIEDQKIKLKHPIVGCIVNNTLKELYYDVYHPKHIKFIDITHTDGIRMYTRSLCFVLYKAVRELYPDTKLNIEHSVSKGYYCELTEFSKSIDEKNISAIKNKMQEIITADIPFVRNEIKTSEAIEVYKKHGLLDKSKLFESRKGFYTSIYNLGDTVDYFYGHLIPSSGYLKVFDLVKYYDGMLLQIPKRNNPSELQECVKQDKMFDIFREYKSWVKILEVQDVGSLNEFVAKRNATELIKISEALHEKKVANIADKIQQNIDKLRVVLISGPSSSGKTSFCKRLAVHLKVLGLKPISISLDNYFVDRDRTPKDADGEYDFEALEAIDIKLFNENLIDLQKGKEVFIPKFVFATGSRVFNEKPLSMNKDNILLVEGIHALNPKLTPDIAADSKFKIYVSALTQIAIDSHNRIPTTDNRLIRRMVRDFKYRNYSALNTIKRWPSVRRGEEKNIFPYQEEADVMFNSALLYELGVLKRYAEPLIKSVSPDKPEYLEAQRLLKFLSYFSPVPDEEIPPTSIMREFLGGSSFNYK